MYLYHKFNQQFRHSLFTICLICGVVYFVYHAFSGNRGIIAMIDFTYQLDQSKTELIDVRNQREALQHRVDMLRNESIDLDLLDEQARKMLGYAQENEVVIFSKDIQE